MSDRYAAQFAELKGRLGEVHDLNQVGWLLSWDQQTMMAQRGGAMRAEQMATLTRVAFEKFTDPAIGRLLDDLRPYQESLEFDADEASLIRVARRDYEKAVKVPSDLRAEMTRASATARQAWVQARAANDFAAFLPHLERNVDLKRRYMECMEAGQAEAYDILLDDFEPEMKTSEVRAVFDALKADLLPLAAAIRERQEAVSDAPVHGDFPPAAQEAFCRALVQALGGSPDAWRLDPTVHPFASRASQQDIRITTRYYPHFLNPALFGTLHEFGHGLYEHQAGPALERTLLSRGASHALHESQSRLWENLVGRSRAFSEWIFPQLQAAYPGALAGVGVEEYYRAINKVQPSLIRVEADEVTYALHIILRFELEQEIIAGTVALRDLPEAWNARFAHYIGIAVPNDAEGVLQDVHWSGGMFGYFPTYALGSIVSAQLWEVIRRDLPGLDGQFRAGEFGALREWLRERLHRHGRKFTPTETLRRALGALPEGGPIVVGPYVRYLRDKYGEIYGLAA